MNKALNFSLKDLRDFKPTKITPGVKYQIEYENNMFKLKPIPPPKPKTEERGEEIAIIELDHKRIVRLLMNEFSHIINTDKVKFDSDRNDYFIHPGTYHIQHFVDSGGISNDINERSIVNFNIKFNDKTKILVSHSTFVINEQIIPASI